MSKLSSTVPRQRHTTLPSSTQDRAHTTISLNPEPIVARDLASTPTSPDTTPAPISSRAPVQSLQHNGDCLLVGEALGICASLSPGFATFPPTAQAKCLCYSSTVYSPNIFDNAVATCASFASTAVPAALGSIQALQGFCNQVGDVEEIRTSTDTLVTTTNGIVGSTVDEVGLATSTTTTSVTFTATRIPSEITSVPVEATSTGVVVPATDPAEIPSIIVPAPETSTISALGLGSSAPAPTSPEYIATTSTDIPTISLTVPTFITSSTKMDIGSTPIVIIPSSSSSPSTIPTTSSKIDDPTSLIVSTTIPSTTHSSVLTVPTKMTTSHRSSTTSKSSSLATKSKTTSSKHSTLSATPTSAMGSKALLGKDISSVDDVVGFSLAMAVLVLFL